MSLSVRIVEPAVGAFAAAGVMLVPTVFTPYSFIAFSGSKLIIGGFVATAAGQRLMGNR